MQFTILIASFLAATAMANPLNKRTGDGVTPPEPTTKYPTEPTPTPEPTYPTSTYPTEPEPTHPGEPGEPGNPGNPYDACSGLYDSLQCCATDVLGVADLDCASPPDVPTSPEDFGSICASIGQRARCCILPVAGQSILCQTPLGLGF